MTAQLDGSDATRNSLGSTCKHLRLPRDDEARRALRDAYLRITPYPDAPAALNRLRVLDLPPSILSNGSTRSIRSVVSTAGLEDRFAQLISVGEVRIFKPHHDVYALAERSLAHPRSTVLFVSSNAWDASGARLFGYAVCWISRTGNTFEELEQSSDHTMNGLEDLANYASSFDPPDDVRTHVIVCVHRTLSCSTD